MKKLFLFFLLLSSLQPLFAQITMPTVPYEPMSYRYYYVPHFLRVGSGLMFPNRDTTWKPTEPAVTHWQGKLFYYSPYSTKWVDVTTENTANPPINFLYRKAGKDSIFYVKNGLEYSIKDSSGSPRIKEFGNGATSKLVGDSVKVSVGGTLEDSVTLFYIPVGAKTDQSTLAGSRSFVISNRPYTGFSGTDWGYWNRRGNNSLLSLERLLYESENDTAYTQYMAPLKTLGRITFDRYSTRFSYATKPIMVQEQGNTATVQIYFPEHKVALKPSPHGRTGAAFNGTSGFGDFYGYEVAIEPTIPGYPQSSNVAQTDFNRVADDNYRKKMTGPITN